MVIFGTAYFIPDFSEISFITDFEQKSIYFFCKSEPNSSMGPKSASILCSLLFILSNLLIISDKKTPSPMVGS